MTSNYDEIYALAAERWEKLTLADDFLFSKIMSDKALCTEMLRRILPDIDIGDISFPEVQKPIKDNIYSRGVRLDVYSKSDGKVYDVEIQTTAEKDLARRSRAYHISIGSDILNKDTLKETHTYRDLPDAFVIFICTFDPFRQNRHIYTFKNICCEDNNIQLNDGTVTIFLNAKGRLDDISPELKAFLNLIMGKTSEDPYIIEIDRRLRLLKQNPLWRSEYMMMSIHDQDKLLEGMNRGIAIGEARGIAIGEVRGEASGKIIARKSVAVEMLREGLPLDMIARIVKESVSVVQGWITEEESKS